MRKIITFISCTAVTFLLTGLAPPVMAVQDNTYEFPGITVTDNIEENGDNPIIASVSIEIPVIEPEPMHVEVVLIEEEPTPAPEEPTPTVVEEEVVETSVGSSSIVDIALSYTGVPYVWGGTTPSGWDCVGFVSFVLTQSGVPTSNSYESILSAGYEVPYSDMKPGDILYQQGHVSIYIGNDQNVGAWNPSLGTTTGPNSWLGEGITVIRVR